MSGINKVMLIGHLGRDPEFRILENGVAVSSFPLLSFEDSERNGAIADEMEAHNIIMWHSVAERASKLLKKGKLIYLKGRLKTKSFEDKSGIKKTHYRNSGQKLQVAGPQQRF